ncbi:hypothetical protein ABZ695_30400 [Streptomyces sp. NPDC006976]|uniref:hypothetical protein n=1 Tax=Streptomyces sp. NPDC006976 TaxID=3154311 RepID=UPI003406449B
MRRQTRVTAGRRGALLTASAAVLFLGGASAGCGGAGGGDDGYTALGAAATAPGQGPSGAVAPSDDVTLIPLDGARSGTKGGGGASPSPGPSRGGGTDTARPGGPGSASGSAAGRTTSSPGPSGSPAAPATGTTAPPHGTPGTTDPASPPRPTDPTSPTAPTGPAVLHVGTPVRAAADDRWCEKVTVEFRNSGGAPVRSGTVTFATHVIGGLGVDWATLESTAPLPAPIDAGAARKKTYTVCADAWRVPLGMRVETRDVTAVWK